MANFYSTKDKLGLAKNIIADFCGDLTASGCNSPDSKSMQKMEQKYNKSKGRYCDLSDFCIRLSEMPQLHYKLMVSISWLDCATETPAKDQAGFYQSFSSDKQGIAKVEYFITIDKDTQRLFIELNIRELFKLSR